MKQVIKFCLICILAVAAPIYADDSSVDDSGADDNQTFHVYEDIDLVSTLKLEYYKPRIVAKAVYPQLASDTDSNNVTVFNDTALQLVQDEFDSFQSRVRDVRDVQQLQKNIPRSQISNNLYVDYDASYIKSNDDHVLSIRYSIQGYIPGLQRPYHYHRALNYNVDTDEKIELTDILDPNSNYLQALSEYTGGVLSRAFRNRGYLPDGTAPLPENYTIWNIKPNGILITFEEGRVAPVIYGAQTVLVPFSVLTPYLLSDSEIAGCVKHNRTCRNNNLLTGGFIDQTFYS